MAAVLLLSLAGGCVAKGRLQEQLDQNEALSQRLEETAGRVRLLEQERNDLQRRLEEARRAGAEQQAESQARIGALESRVDAVQHEAARKEQGLGSILQTQGQEIARLRSLLDQTSEEVARRNQELHETTVAHDRLVEDLQKEIETGSIKISRLKDRLSLEIVDKILFSSGSDHITSQGKEVLTKVSEVLKGIRENSIRIEGHTDNVPIGARIKERFPSNWELSTARATQVVRYLVELGVPPEILAAIGLSQYHPVASNDTPEGRQRNRRIEIVLFPKDLREVVREIE